MNKKESPAETGTITQKPNPNILDTEAPVKSSISDNLIFFHSVLEDLPAEEYKIAMSAICQYIATGTVPALTGLLKAVILLAIDRIAGQQHAPRKRGGQIGNKNAVKKQSSIETDSEKRIENESKTNKDESLHGVQTPVPVPVSATVGSTAVPSVPVAVSPPNLNLKNKENLNNSYLNYLNCENESETARRNRIKNNLKRFGFILADKTVSKIIESVPDVMWLTQGYDFPTYLAQYVSDAYKNKGKSNLELQKLFISALNPEKWETPWTTYPNWLSQKMEAVLIDREALLRKTPPQKHCPDCGTNTPLDGLRCPKCGGFYKWDESTKCHDFIHHLNFSMSERLEQTIAEKERKKREAQNAGIV